MKYVWLGLDRCEKGGITYNGEVLPVGSVIDLDPKDISEKLMSGLVPADEYERGMLKKAQDLESRAAAIASKAEKVEQEKPKRGRPRKA